MKGRIVCCSCIPMSRPIPMIMMMLMILIMMMVMIRKRRTLLLHFLFNDVEQATQNCNILHVILTDQHRDQQCLAIMGQFESFHIHRLMRHPKDKRYEEVDPHPRQQVVVEHPPTDHNNTARSDHHEDSSGEEKRSEDEEEDDEERSIMDSFLPLRPVPRGQEPSDGRLRHELPTTEMMKENWKALQQYKSIVTDHFLHTEIQPLVEHTLLMASHTNNSENFPNTNTNNNNNTVIVMVCNFGQSELLLNCTYLLYKYIYGKTSVIVVFVVVVVVGICWRCLFVVFVCLI